MTEAYFAYASNMASDVIARLCPGHRYLGAASLADHRLAFTRRSVKTGTGVADIVPSPGETVWGALYEIEDRQLAAIDRKEGLGWAYTRVRIPILLAKSRQEYRALTYMVIHREPTEISPSRQYLDNIIAAARARGLPIPYIKQLEAVATASTTG